ncbi:helix-turn-helix domain-containing protein [Flammeovirga yaeyamensis]|uniref:Helix-turn-helix domain-containing protein n=1 Tax=Flammeovirga yaeyamensis TaxID=367791 RepID=A0AAX1N254_9BACT|nr:AraC family transcriptional regulator [Flammeovirga yaeyamensis]MBB3701197.1 AraC-like DNA-binding protein [Flammeovirga yaeyamensis]NMF38477.1 helix-turn-helix transcriptional regulator [Flammeovirga yaeyamensis]QWG01663.1 helix-turn-helix domain-containing protein [Flammeovirga yaeyamensis]
MKEDQIIVEIFDRENWVVEAAPQIGPFIEESDKHLVMDNDLGKARFELINIEDGLFIRYSDVTLNHNVLFKEHGRKSKAKFMVFEFAFHGYPEGMTLSHFPDKSLSDEKNILIYSDNSSIYGNFPANLHHTFLTLYVSFDWLKRNFKDFLKSHSYFDIGIETNRTFFNKMEYGVHFEKTLEQLMSRSYPLELRKPIYKGVVLMIVSEVYYRLTDGAEAKYSMKKEIQGKLDELEQYIKDNLEEEISIEDLCKRIGFSKTKLHHLFKDYFKYSMYDYIKFLRMQKAKSLIVGTNLGISEIANKVGYNSVTHFTNLFKKETGLTPTQFKKGGYTEVFEGLRNLY